MKFHFSAATISIFLVITTFANAKPSDNEVEQSPTSVPEDFTKTEPADDSFSDSLSETEASDQLSNIAESFKPPKTYDEKDIDDAFYKYYADPKVDVCEVISVVISWDADKQRHHFQYLRAREHANEEDAERAQKIIRGAQQLLDYSLMQVHSEIPMTIDKYIEYMYQYKISQSLQNEIVENILKRLDQYKDEALEKALDAGEKMQEDYHSDHVCANKPDDFIRPQSQPAFNADKQLEDSDNSPQPIQNKSFYKNEDDVQKLEDEDNNQPSMVDE